MDLLALLLAKIQWSKRRVQGLVCAQPGIECIGWIADRNAAIDERQVVIDLCVYIAFYARTIALGAE